MSFGNTNQCCCGNHQWQTYFVVRVQPRTCPHPPCLLGIGGAITDGSEGLLGLLGFALEQHSSEHWLPSLFLGCAPHRRWGSDFDDWATEQRESQGDSGSCLGTEIQFWILCVPLVSSVLLGKQDCLLGMWLMLGIIIFSFKSPATTSTSHHPPPLAYLLSCYRILLCTRFCFLCALGEQVLESITRKEKGLVKASEEDLCFLPKIGPGKVIWYHSDQCNTRGSLQRGFFSLKKYMVRGSSSFLLLTFLFLHVMLGTVTVILG